MNELTSILDIRAPRPGRYADYGVPASIAEATDVLLRYRNWCSDQEVDIIDAAIVRPLAPWILTKGGA